MRTTHRLGSSLSSRALLAALGAGALAAASCGGDGGTTTSTTTTATGGGVAGCPEGFSPCGGACVDTDWDPAHCGACEQACGDQEQCSEGSCQTLCHGTTTRCGEACVDTDWDPAHCGGCEQTCDPGELCSEGACSGSCGGGTTPCGELCKNLDDDPQHCGACDSACAPGEVCTAKVCCPAGHTSCDGTCVDLDADPASCGACGKACKDDETCQSGACAKPTSCLDLFASYPELASGQYELDPDGPGGESSFVALCDMEGDGGGYTLVARFSSKDADNWMQDDADWWFARTSTAGKPLDPADNADMLAEGFWRVSGTGLRISKSDDPTHAFLLRTTGGCLDSMTLRGKLLGFKLGPTESWGQDSALSVCPGELGASYLGVAGFGFADCPEAWIGGKGALAFFATFDNGGAVMMIGGAHETCGDADHGIGLTESPSSTNPSFTFANTDEVDFGNDADDGAVGAYALNLWIR